MDDRQMKAQDLALRGHNIVITGQGGTGKTFLIKQLCKDLSKKGTSYAVTSTTGLGATLFGRTTTIHKFIGLEDGRHQNNQLLHLIQTDERFLTAKSNILNTDVLIIDEVSMLSSKVLKQIEYVCRGVRKKEKYFGGMQVALSGDFYQLQPIKTELYGDFGQPCFQVAWFDDVFPHRIKLNVIYRQSEVKLIKAVHELETGHLSEETNILMKSLSRDLPPDQLVNAVHLFSRNVDVLLFNKNKLEQLHGQLHSFVSEDEGSKHYIDTFLAPQHLGLKIGCPVMLLVNLSDTLVNGKIGSVKHIEKNKIHVEFMISGKERVVNIERFIFTKYDPISNTMIAKRRQFPLTLPYSFTIHKAQGMSIKNLVIDCKNSTFPGQIGVAVGRAISLDGLRVKKFIPSLCCPHPQEISRFYNKFKEGCSDELESLSCCRAKKLIQGKDNEWEIRKTESENNNDSKRSEVSKVTCK